jgi:FAD/FMN-containing dehydrogenase
MLATGFDGAVVRPGDDDYDAVRSVWNAMVDRKPAVIARCTSRSDVAAAVRFGRSAGLEIGVRCGGHSVLGLSVPEGGLMIDLTPMGGVRVDPDRRRAWVQGGALLGALDRATQAHGLATTAGNVSHTGVGGLTLAGGMGWLARQFGLGCDNVASFEVVTADGEVLRASDTENADLYWGLRGGGGNFGIVTEFEFRLHPIDGRALVADVFFPVDRAEEPLAAWRDLIRPAPRQATFTAWIGPAGDWPFLPAEYHGRRLAWLGYVWVGDPDAGRGLLPALRAVGSPVAERVLELSYLDLQRIDDDQEGHNRRRYWKGHYFRDLPDEALRALLAGGSADPGTGSDGFLPYVNLQSHGGAIAEVAEHETAFGFRDSLVELVAAASWTDPAEDAGRIAGARRYAGTLEPFATGGYANNAADEGQREIWRSYPDDKLARLTELKDRYDPHNVFHLNQNIPPSSWNRS